MSVRRLIIILTLGIMVVIVFVLVLISNRLFLSQFDSLDQQVVQEQIDRAVQVIQDRKTALETLAQDWGVWNASYTYALGENPSFWEENWSDITFESLGVDLIGVIGADHHLISGYIWNSNTDTSTTLSDDITTYLHSYLYNLQDDSGAVSGLVNYGGDYYLIAANPILMTDGRGPNAGVLVFGIRVDEGFIAEIESASGLDHLSLSTATRDPNTWIFFSHLESADGNFVISDILSQTESGYLILNNPTGTPEGVLGFNEPRTIFLQGRNSIEYLIVTVGVVCLLLMTIFLIILEYQIIRPMQKLVAKSKSQSWDLENTAGGASKLGDRAKESRDPFTAMLTQIQNWTDKSAHNLELFAGLVNQSREGLAILDPETLEVFQANPTFRRIISVDPSDESGKSFLDLIQKLSWPKSQVDAISRFLKSKEQGESPVYEIPVSGTDKATDLEVYISKSIISNQQNIFVMLRDVSERKKLERKVQVTLEETLLMNRVIAAASSTLEIDKIYNLICEKIARYLDIPLTAIGILDKKKENLTIVAEYCEPGQVSALGNIIPLEGNPTSQFVVENKQPVVIQDVQNDPRMAAVKEIMAERGTKSLMIVPIIMDEKVIGTLGVDSLVPREFSIDEIALVSNVALAASSAIKVSQLYFDLNDELNKRKEMEKELALREHYLTAMVEVQNILLLENNFQKACERTMEVLGKASGASRVYTFMNHSDENGNLLTSQIAEWVSTGIQPQIDNPALQNLPFSNLPRWFKNLSNGKEISGRVKDFPQNEKAILDPQKIQSILVFPLFQNKKFNGFIGFDNCTNEKSWGKGEIALLKMASTALSLAQSRINTEAELIRSQSSLSMMMDQLPTLIWTSGIDLNINSLRGSYLNTLGLQDKDSFIDLLKNEGKYDQLMQDHKVAFSGETVSREMDWLGRVFQYVVKPMKDAEGNITGVLGLSLDITSQKDTLKELAEQRDFALQIMNTMGQGLTIIDEKNQYTYVNNSFADMMGYKPEELIGIDPFALTLPNDIEIIKNARNNRLAGKSTNYEIRLMHKNGSIVYVMNTAVPLMREGRNVGAIIVVTDLKDRRNMEAKILKNAESMRALYEISSMQETTLTEKVQSLLVLGCQLFEMQTGIFSKVEGKVYKIQDVYSVHQNLEPGMEFDLRKTYCQEVLKASGPVAFEHASNSEWFKHPCFKETHMESFIGTPVFVAGKVYGTLNFSSLTPHKEPFTAAEKEFLRLVSQWLGTELEREQILGQLQQNAVDIEKANQDLSVARDQALQASRLKSEFLATMSHEIRTPMNAVIGMSELLLETQQTREQKEYTEILRDSAQMLLTIINDILDFSKIEAGKLILEEIDFPLIDTVESAVELFTPKARQKGLSLMVYVAPDVPTVVRGDPTRLRQVITNLVGNAMKFTEQGEVTVYIELLEKKIGSTKLKIRVTDTGIGMSEESRKSLFQPFTQADGSTTRKYGGTGLGLAISRRIVEMMKGSIGIESEVGKGSTFWFIIEVGNSEISPVVSSSVVTPDNREPKVLVVDDNQTHLDILKKYFLNWGMKAVACKDPTRVVGMMRAASKKGSPFDLVVLDQEMPEMTGTDLVYSIKNDEACRKSKLILMTAFDQVGLGDEAIKLGFNAFLTKPIRQSMLYDTVAMVLSSTNEVDLIKPGKRSTKPLYPPRDMAPIRMEAHPDQRGVILLAEDNPANQKLATAQMEKLGLPFDIVGNGYEAIKKLDEHPDRYAMVLMDVQMPIMDGFEATGQIREKEKTTGKHIPIIAMTANAMESDKRECLDAGMDDYLSKPVRMANLQQISEKWLMHLQPKVETPSPEVEMQIPEKETLDADILEGIKTLQGVGEPDFLQELVETLDKDGRESLKKLHTAFTAGDLETTRKTAHSLKGSSANLGSTRFSKISARIEEAASENNVAEIDELLPTLDVAFEDLINVLRNVK